MVPTAWRPLMDELSFQQSFIDQLSAAWISEYQAGGGRIYCGRGCRDCCSLTVNCTFGEALLLAERLNDEQSAAVAAYVDRLKSELSGCNDLKQYLRMQRSVLGWCPLLDGEGTCSAYAVRPLACRALLSTKESRWCGIDFAALTSEEKQAYVEALDRSVVAFPLHYVATTRETGGELEERALKLQLQTFGFSLYGNLPVLLYLERQQALSARFCDGRRAVEEAIRQTGLLHHFVVTFAG